MSSLQAAAIALKIREVSIILEDIISARHIALSAQPGVVPCWQGVLEYPPLLQTTKELAELLQPRKMAAQWARASQGHPRHNVDERKISSHPRLWVVALQCCMDRGTVRVADLRADGQWATPVALPTSMHAEFHALCSLVQHSQRVDVVMPPGRTVVVALLQGAAHQAPEQSSALAVARQQAAVRPVKDRSVWLLTTWDTNLWKERQGLLRHLREAGHGDLLCAVVRNKTEFLQTTLRRLRNATGRDIRPALESTLREFQAAGGFLLVPWEWWADRDCHSEFPSWFAVPVDIEKHLPDQAPALELLAVDLWGSEFFGTRCRETRCEAIMLQEGCTSAAAGGIWKWHQSKNGMHSKLL